MTADMRAEALAISVQDAELKVQRLFALIKSNANEAEETLVAELQAAQSHLASLKCAEQRVACEQAITSAGGGETAALLLEELTTSGVEPDRGCFLAALRACAHPSDRSLAGEWALMIYDDACTAGFADGVASSLALHACVHARSWGTASSVLAAATRVRALPPYSALEALLACCSHAADDTASSSSSSAHTLPARLAIETAEALLQALERYWQPGTMAIRVPGRPTAAAIVTLVCAVLRELYEEQVRHGPSASVVKSAIRVVLSAPEELEGHGGSGGGGMDDAMATERQCDAWLGGGGELWADLTAAPPIAARSLDLPAARGIVPDVTAQLRERLGCEALEVEVGVDTTDWFTVTQAGIDEWLRTECVAVWHADTVALADRQRAAEAKLAAEAAARDAAAAAAAASTVALRESLEERWASRNARRAAALERERLNERNAFAVAIDTMTERVASANGIDVDELLNSPPAPPAPPPSIPLRSWREQLSDAASDGAVQAQGFSVRRAPRTLPNAPAAGATAADAAVQSEGAYAGPLGQSGRLGVANLCAVKGIGAKRAEKLEAAGVDTIEALASLDAGAASVLAKDHGLPLKALMGSILAARELLACDGT